MSETQMVAAEPPKKTKMVKVRALRPFIPYGSGKVAEPGSVVEVPEEQVAAITKDNWGTFAYFGDRRGKDKPRNNLKIAELV